jgi:hypothetical protein
MPPNRCRSRFLLAVAMLVALVSDPVRADVDLSGRWLNSLPSASLYRCLDVAHTGTVLRLGLTGALPPVTVQLRRADAPLCWEARFPVLGTSTGIRMRARDGQ